MRSDNKPPPTGETYIRQLPYSAIKYLSLMLDIDKNWEKLVVKIPKRLTDVGKSQCEKRYTTLQVRLFDEKSKRPDGSPTKSILDDWSTQNAKVKHLIRVLQEASLYEAANYISEEVLHEGKVARLDAQEENNPSELPVPAWNDNKLKKINEPKDANKPDSVLDVNKDVQGGKLLYNKGIDVLDKEQPGSTYNSLIKSEDDGCAYNKLVCCSNKDVIYNRTPSFDSWESVSVQNEAGIVYSEHSSGIEQDETLQIRSMEDVTIEAKAEDLGVYTYAKGVYQFAKEVPERSSDPYSDGPSVAESREPCQNEEAMTPETTKEDLYKILGQQNLTYSLLQNITDDFNVKLLKDGGRIIGTGGFGEVFLGKFDNGFQVAIKRLKAVDEGVEKQFETELSSLIKYRHKNIVRLYGYSIDGPGKCLVYEYLCNGSLEDRLMRHGQTPPLSTNLRISILKGTAQGICYLNRQGTVHRDIKSANVLLDENFEPKVGDFATARSAPRGNTTAAMSTSVVIGTSAYLAPEAFHFDVSTKLDSFSFGIIILEVMTSLPPLDHSREEKDIKSYVEDRGISPLLDTSGGKWLDETVAALVDISEKCTATKKKNRANVQDILEDLMAVA